jgi:hypothetical protein
MRVPRDGADAEMRGERPRDVGTHVVAEHGLPAFCDERIVELERGESGQCVELDASHKILLRIEDGGSTFQDDARLFAERERVQRLDVDA